METKETLSCRQIKSEAYRISIDEDGKEIGRASLFLITNDLNEKPYGLLEDVFVDDDFRNQGLGTKLVSAIIEKAKELDCYKLIATSRYERPKVHALYQKIGFQDHGKEFRMDF